MLPRGGVQAAQKLQSQECWPECDPQSPGDAVQHSLSWKCQGLGLLGSFQISRGFCGSRSPGRITADGLTQPPPDAVHALLAVASITSRVLGGKSKILALLSPGALEALVWSRRSASATLLSPVFICPEMMASQMPAQVLVAASPELRTRQYPKDFSRSLAGFAGYILLHPASSDTSPWPAFPWDSKLWQIYLLVSNGDVQESVPPSIAALRIKSASCSLWA